MGTVGQRRVETKAEAETEAEAEEGERRKTDTVLKVGSQNGPQQADLLLRRRNVFAAPQMSEYLQIKKVTKKFKEKKRTL